MRNFWLPLSQVIKVRLLEEQLFIADQREVDIKNDVIINGKAHQNSNQLEVDVRFM
jgi:hypothetical protein